MSFWQNIYGRESSTPKSPWLPSQTVPLPTPQARRSVHLLACALVARLRSRAPGVPVMKARFCWPSGYFQWKWRNKKADDRTGRKREVGLMLSCLHQWTEQKHTTVGLVAPKTRERLAHTVFIHIENTHTHAWIRRRKQGAGNTDFQQIVNLKTLEGERGERVRRNKETEKRKGRPVWGKESKWWTKGWNAEKRPLRGETHLSPLPEKAAYIPHRHRFA